MDGKVLYVEPFMAESNPRGDVFLAGRYNFLGELDTLNNWKPVGQDGDVVGAYLPHVGPPRLVRPPLPGRRLSGFHAVPRGDSSWLVVFGTAQTRADGTYPDTTMELWSARYDGWRWTHLHALPPPPRPAGTDRASSLVVRSDTVFWAISVAGGLGTTPGVELYRNVADKWTATFLPAFIAEVELASAPELKVALVGPDPTLRSDGNSLVFWTVSPRWSRLGSLVPSRQEEVMHVNIQNFADGVGITWNTPAVSRGRAAGLVRAMVAELPDRDARSFTIDTAATGMPPFAPVRWHRDTPLWVTGHHSATGAVEIQFAIYQKATASSRVIGRFAQTYATPFIATSAGDEEVIVSGGYYEPKRYVVSLLRRFRVRCNEGAGPDPPRHIRARSSNSTSGDER